MGQHLLSRAVLLVLAVATVASCATTVTGDATVDGGGVRGPTRPAVLGQLDLPLPDYTGWEVVDATARPTGVVEGDAVTEAATCTTDIRQTATTAEVPDRGWSGSIGTDTGSSPSSFTVYVFEGGGDLGAVTTATEACPAAQLGGQTSALAATPVPQAPGATSEVGYVTKTTGGPAGSPQASTVAEVVYLAVIGERTLRVGYRSIGTADTTAASKVFQLAASKASKS